MNNNFVNKLLNMWRNRALKAESRIKYLEKLLKENNVSFEPDSS
jgi:hypothetical protein